MLYLQVIYRELAYLLNQSNALKYTDETFLIFWTVHCVSTFYL